MPAEIVPQPTSSHIYEVDASRRFEVHATRPTHPHSFVLEKDPTEWVWCMRCERAFQLGEAPSTSFGLSCAYPDCGGEALDFWSWEAFCAFVGDGSLVPDYAQRYALSAAR